MVSEKMFIYSLSHPKTNSVFYIGQSKNVYVRVLNHVQKSYLLKSKKDEIISEICKLGLLPKWEILEEINVDVNNILSIMNVSNRETFWIRKYNIGGELTNLQKTTQQELSSSDFGVTKKCIYCGQTFKAVTAKKKFCSDKCRVYFNRGINSTEISKAKHIKSANMSRIIIEDLVSEKFKDKKYPLAESECFTPKTLQELKTLCPQELTGLERSQWIANKRQEYGL